MSTTTVEPTISRLDLSDPRYWQQNAKSAIRDIYDALVELITNADDAYARQRTSGTIEIEVERRRKGAPTRVCVRDFSTGLTRTDMETKLKSLGSRHNSGLAAGQNVRGTNSRGAKDVAALGTVTYESITDGNMYAKCCIKPDGEFQQWPESPATGTLRQAVGIPKGTGTLVTIEVAPAYPVPQHGTLKSKLEQLVPLRDLLDGTELNVVLTDLRQGRKERLRSRTPEGKERVSETIDIQGYNAKAKLKIYRAKKPLNGRGKFRIGGILVTSRRAVHEATLFASELESDPHAAVFFGRLRCEYIDDLWNDYDERSEGKLPPDPANPAPIVDPLRQSGLRRDHPFFDALQKEVLRRLRPLVDEERRLAASQRAKIENDETRKRLNSLERLATSFIRENEEDVDFDSDNSGEDDRNTRGVDVRISPPFAQLIVGQTRKYTLLINMEKHPEFTAGSTVQISCGTGDVSADPRSCYLEPHRSDTNLLQASWKVTAIQPTPATEIVARTGSIVKSALLEVLASEKDRYSGIDKFMFQRKRYQLRPGVRKTVRILAPCPACVSSDVAVEIECDDKGVSIKGDRVMHRREDLGIAECRIHLTCDQPDTTATLRATIPGHHGTAGIVCGPPEGEAIKISIENEDFVNQRYRWVRGTNNLQIGARHPSLRRYLGAANQGFPGQNRPQFQVLLAEIVAFAIAEKLLVRKAQQDPSFRDLDVDGYLYERDKLVTAFLPRAHENQVPKPE